MKNRSYPGIGTRGRGEDIRKERVQEDKCGEILCTQLV
jgi:hypothetical protein